MKCGAGMTFMAFIASTTPSLQALLSAYSKTHREGQWSPSNEPCSLPLTLNPTLIREGKSIAAGTYPAWRTGRPGACARW